MITCWELGGRGDHYNRTRQLAEWSPRQTLITGIAVNSDPGSEACLAVSVTLSGSVYFLQTYVWGCADMRNAVQADKKSRYLRFGKSKERIVLHFTHCRPSLLLSE